MASGKCRHVIIETNKTTARIFPEVPDCENDQFWNHMETLISLNQRLADISASDSPDWQKNMQRAPIFAGFAKNLIALFAGKTMEAGSIDFEPETAMAV